MSGITITEFLNQVDSILDPKPGMELYRATGIERIATFNKFWKDNHQYIHDQYPKFYPVITSLLNHSMLIATRMPTVFRLQRLNTEIQIRCKVFKEEYHG